MDKPPRCFYEIYETLPRQGPGDRDATLRALACLPPLTSRHRVLDVGCGSGAQTLDLANATSALITAVDNHGPFLDLLKDKVGQLGLGHRVSPQIGDMADLPFENESFDVIWSEGAVFIIGFDKALAAWRRLLRPHGHMVISEMCWLREDPPAEAREFLAAEGADIVDITTRRHAIAGSGYRLVADFVLPRVGWWENYYVPLADRTASYRAEHVADAEAQAVTAGIEHEIEIYRRHGDSFGYGFFVLAWNTADEIPPS